MNIRSLFLLLFLLFTLQFQLPANDPPLPPEVHEDEEDRIPGGGASLEDHWILLSIMAGAYITIRIIHGSIVARNNLVTKKVNQAKNQLNESVLHE